MKLEAKIINFKKAVRNNKPKNYVTFKFNEYMKEYDSDTRTLMEKLNHHDLFMEYCNYMKKT